MLFSLAFPVAPTVRYFATDCMRLASAVTESGFSQELRVRPKMPQIYCRFRMRPGGWRMPLAWLHMTSWNVMRRRMIGCGCPHLAMQLTTVQKRQAVHHQVPPIAAAVKMAVAAAAAAAAAVVSLTLGGLLQGLLLGMCRKQHMHMP